MASQQPPLLSQAAQGFILYARTELRFAPQTISKYEECLRHVRRTVGDRIITEYSRSDVHLLKASMLERNLSVGRQLGILASLKGLLLYCRNELALGVMDSGLVTLPRRPRREVSYLTADEVARFVKAIDIVNRNGSICEAALRFRALVEVLLGSAMRISEALSLDRASLDYETREARIIGKGNKQRTVFFTARALSWVRRYLDARADSHPAVFVSINGRSRLSRADVWRPFGRYRIKAGIPKRVTPHLLRHTAATQLLFNGCPVGHIKEILGHERLETTCRYYLGLDHRAAKQAHQRFLTYSDTDCAAV